MTLRLCQRVDGFLRPLVVVLAWLVLPVSATTVRMETSMGVIDIELFDTSAPATVNNFLAYVRRGSYDSSFIHRNAPGFVVQGGGYRWNISNTVSPVAATAPVVNEFSPARSNLRGTIAMAKLGGDPNSATNQWFINLGNNAANLDAQNGGFTVFGRVLNEGMNVVDAIAALPLANLNSGASGPFDSVPVAKTLSTSITAENLVIVTRVATLPDTVAVNMAAGWNLVGNGVDKSIDVGVTFADASRFATVWKWQAAQSVWGFYAPALAAKGGTALADYAAAKGYQVLTTLSGGEGFWVNALQAGSINMPSTGNLVTAQGSLLTPGWNLVSVGKTATPKQFSDAQGASISTLWAWDNPLSQWYFYAPSLDASGALVNYIAGKGYLDFNQHSKALSSGTGFWVNKLP